MADEKTVSGRRKDPRRFTDWSPENVRIVRTGPEAPATIPVPRVTRTLRVPRASRLTRKEVAEVRARAARNLERSRRVHAHLLARTKKT